MRKDNSFARTTAVITLNVYFVFSSACNKSENLLMNYGNSTCTIGYAHSEPLILNKTYRYFMCQWSNFTFQRYEWALKLNSDQLKTIISEAKSASRF